jgi:hypothetical protein
MILPYFDVLNMMLNAFLFFSIGRNGEFWATEIRQRNEFQYPCSLLLYIGAGKAGILASFAHLDRFIVPLYPVY